MFVGLTGKSRQYEGCTVHQVLATETISVRIPAGSVGGWVENPELIQNKSWVSKDSVVLGDSLIAVNTVIEGSNLIVDSELSGNIRVSGQNTIRNSNVSGKSMIVGYTEICDSNVFGDTKIVGGSFISDSTIDGKVSVLERTRICGGVRVFGRAVFSGDVFLCGDIKVVGDCVLSGHVQVKTSDGGVVILDGRGLVVTGRTGTVIHAGGRTEDAKRRGRASIFVGGGTVLGDGVWEGEDLYIFDGAWM